MTIHCNAFSNELTITTYSNVYSAGDFFKVDIPYYVNCFLVVCVLLSTDYTQERYSSTNVGDQTPEKYVIT